MLEADGSIEHVAQHGQGPAWSWRPDVELREGAGLSDVGADVAVLLGAGSALGDDRSTALLKMNRNSAYTKKVGSVVPYAQLDRVICGPSRASGYANRTGEGKWNVKYVLVGLDIILGVAVLVLIFLHSGRMRGWRRLSEVAGAFGGSGVVQKNLDRLTVACAVAFFIVSIALVYVI